MNKKIIAVIALSATMAAPTLTFAQSANGPVTRASIRAELLSLQRVGYNPAVNDINYPQNLQAAEHRLAIQNGNSAGESVSGTSASGPAAAQ